MFQHLLIQSNFTQNKLALIVFLLLHSFFLLPSCIYASNAKMIFNMLPQGMELQFWVCRISSWCHLKSHCMSRHLVTLFCNIMMWNSSSLHSTQYILYNSYEQAINCTVDFLNYCQINSITDTNMAGHIIWPKVCHHLTITATHVC